MKRILILTLYVLLFFSCEKKFEIETPDLYLDGAAQTVEMKATGYFGIREIYDWSYNESGDLIEDTIPIGEPEPRSTHDYVGDWFEIHVDNSDSRIAKLTVSSNDTGLTRKITIRASCWGKGDRIHITQNPL